MQQVSADMERYRTQHGGACPAKLADAGTRVCEDMDAAKYFKDEKSNGCTLIYKVHSVPYDITAIISQPSNGITSPID